MRLNLPGFVRHCGTGPILEYLSVIRQGVGGTARPRSPGEFPMTTATVVPIRREFQVHRFDSIKHGVLSRHIALPWEDRDAFEEEAADEADPDAGGYRRNTDGLAEFLYETRAWLENRLEDHDHAPLVTEQAHGMAIDIKDLERNARIEAHLDQKMQRLLAMLKEVGRRKAVIRDGA